MTNVKRDNNQIPTMSGVLNTDGVTVTPIKASPSTNLLSVSDGTTGTVTSRTDAPRDDNRVPTMMAVSSSGGATPVTLAVDSSGKLLIQTT